MNSDSDGVPGGDEPHGDDGARAGQDPETGTAVPGGFDDGDVTDDTDRVLADMEADLQVDELAGRTDDDVSERRPVAVGARATAGSARAAARASAARAAAVTAAKGRPTPTRARGKGRPNLASRISRYLKEVVSELRKVIWPTRNEMVTYSIVVVLFLIFMIAVTWGADFGFARLILLIFG